LVVAGLCAALQNRVLIFSLPAVPNRFLLMLACACVQSDPLPDLLVLALLTLYPFGAHSRSFDMDAKIEGAPKGTVGKPLDFERKDAWDMRW
jgi:hypothetical protein